MIESIRPRAWKLALAVVAGATAAQFQAAPGPERTPQALSAPAPDAAVPDYGPRMAESFHK